MREFLKKHQFRIIFWAIFSLIVLYLAPTQYDFYLEEDIKNFRKKDLHRFLAGAWICISVLFLVFSIIKIKPVVQGLFATFCVSLGTAWFFFIFQNLFLAGSLFINRQIKRNTISRTYVAHYLAGTEINKNNLFLYDISAQNFSHDAKLIERLYDPGLMQNDTITLQFEKGLFGILFPSHSSK